MADTTSSRATLIAGNWKMFKVRHEALAFLDTLQNTLTTVDSASLPKVVLCPPFTALDALAQHVSASKMPVTLAAQTMDSHEEGAFTGEIAPGMLRDLGIDHVLIGHSERRQYYSETDETVNQKVLAALKHGITPIICVGESLTQRENNQTDSHIAQQVTTALKGVTPDQLNTLVFAYEPIWAIGTGKTCEAAEANRVCGHIRSLLNTLGNGEQVSILYGGSVNPANSNDLLSQPHIDGALVGGASLSMDTFWPIIQAGIQRHTNANRIPDPKPVGAS